MAAQVRTAGNGGAPALTLSCAPAIRGGYPSGNVHAEGHGNHGMQPSGSSPHYPQVVHGSRQSIDAQYFSGASPRYHSPQSGSSQQSAMAAHASSQSGQGQFAYDHPPPSRHGHHRQRQPPQRDNGMQQGYGDQRAPPHQPSLIEQYTGMHAPSQFIPQQAPQQLSARDLDLHADGAYPGPAISSRKPPSSGVQPQQNPGGRFSLRVGRICEDSAEGLDDGFGRSSRMAGTSHPNRPPAGWLLGSNHDNCQSEAFELPQTNIFRPTSTPYGQARNAERSAPSGRGLQHIASLGPEILQDLDPPLPGMSRHMSHPAHSAQEVPSLDKSHSLSALDMRADRGPHRAGYRDPAAAQAPDGWLQEPAGLSSLPPEPGMLTDPPLCFSAEVPGGDRGEPPNPFAMSQHQRFGDDADWNSQGGTYGSIPQPTHAPPARQPCPVTSDTSMPGGQAHSPMFNNPFENSWQLGAPTPGMEFSAGTSGHGSHPQLLQQDRSSAYSSWAPSKQPSGTLTHLSFPSHPDLTSHVSSQTDGLPDLSTYYLPPQDSNGPATSLYAYNQGDTWGRGSMSSARHTNTNGPFEPDFWQPIDVEAEQSRGGDGGDPWSSSLDGTASLQLADLYTWLDNALESRPEDPANPALQAPARRLAEAPTVPSSPKRISGPMSGGSDRPHLSFLAASTHWCGLNLCGLMLLSFANLGLGYLMVFSPLASMLGTRPSRLMLQHSTSLFTRCSLAEGHTNILMM